MLVGGHGVAPHTLSGNCFRRTDHNRIEKSCFLSDDQFRSWQPAKGNSLIICGLSGLLKNHNPMKKVTITIIDGFQKEEKKCYQITMTSSRTIIPPCIWMVTPRSKLCMQPSVVCCRDTGNARQNRPCKLQWRQLCGICLRNGNKNTAVRHTDFLSRKGDRAAGCLFFVFLQKVRITMVLSELF